MKHPSDIHVSGDNKALFLRYVSMWVWLFRTPVYSRTLCTEVGIAIWSIIGHVTMKITATKWSNNAIELAHHVLWSSIIFTNHNVTGRIGLHYHLWNVRHVFLCFVLLWFLCIYVIQWVISFRVLLMARWRLHGYPSTDRIFPSDLGYRVCTNHNKREPCTSTVNIALISLTILSQIQ